jgi:hypothetical protein
MPNYHATSEGNIPFTAEEEAAWVAQQAAYAAGANDRKAAEVRAERNAKITACDWRVLPDVSNSDVWKTYRQALRDIPAQSVFPNNVTWPDAP